MAIPILKTKLYLPASQARAVPRPRLIVRLNEGLRPGCKLILISAPAGFGKTTLVSEWIQTAGEGIPPVGEGDRAPREREGGSTPPLRFAWLSLDRGDNDPVRFLAYLAAALGSVDEGLGHQVLDAVQSPQPPAAETVLTALLNGLAEYPDPIVLVLDDYHEITALPVHKALLFALEHLPPHVRLVLATRNDPPWPLARLRARQAMVELRTPELRFTLDEAATYLNAVMGLGLCAEDLTTLDARTEGWISGLQMAALALHSRLGAQGPRDMSAFIRAFGGSHRFVLDYLVEEVLERQPAEVQAFMLHTSILDRLCAPLCDALTERTDSQAVLNRLERANLFVVPLDAQRCWYRYHRLFADLLRARLQHMQPDQASVLHRRASAWLERNDLLSEAIDHALAGGDLERAADLVEKNAEATLMRGEVATFVRWIDALPERAVRARPRLRFYYAWTLLWEGRSLGIIESLLQDAAGGEESAGGEGSAGGKGSAGGERIAGSTTALRSLLAAFRGQLSLAIELARRALEELPEEERFVRTFVAWILSATQLGAGGATADSQALDDVLALSQQAGNVMLSFVIECNRAELWMRQGWLERAAATYQRALDRVTDPRGHRLPIAGQALFGLGELSRERGDLEAATRSLAEGMRLIEQWTEIGPLEGYICLARVRWAQGDRAGTWEAIEKARKLAADYDLTELDDLSVAMFQAWFWVAEGDEENAERWARSRDLYRYIDTPLQEKVGDSYEHRMLKYELTVLARLLIAQGRPAQAVRVLAPVAPIAKRRRRTGLLIECLALQALAWRAQGDLDRALCTLDRALTTGEPEGYLRIFVDEGEPMRSLIAAFRSRIGGRDGSIREPAQAARMRAYVDRLLAAYAPSSVQPPVSPPAPPQAPARAQAALIEPLSEREQQVLGLLRTSLSQPEIADRLYVSVNTVRSHVKHIYGKLDVHSRTEAVERAEELGLFS